MSINAWRQHGQRLYTPLVHCITMSCYYGILIYFTILPLGTSFYQIAEAAVTPFYFRKCNKPNR